MKVNTIPFYHLRQFIIIKLDGTLSIQRYFQEFVLEVSRIRLDGARDVVVIFALLQLDLLRV